MGQEMIEVAIRSKKWENVDEELCKAATRKILKLQRCIDIQQGLNYQQVDRLINDGYLHDTLRKICRKDPQFQLSKQRLNSQDIDNLIEEGLIQGAGVSPGTCRRFREGECIERKAFKILCKTLDVSYESAVFSPVSENQKFADHEKQLKLKLALGGFNHLNQWLDFNQLTHHKTIPLYIKNNSSKTERAKWLLNCLIKNFSQQRTPCPQPLLINLSVKSSTEAKINSLFVKLATALKNQKKLGITLKNNSTMPEIAQAIASFIRQKDSIILVFDEVEKLGHDIVDQISKQFWKPLTEEISRYHRLESFQNCLILCYIGTENPQIKARIPWQINVADMFKKEDLMTWMNHPQVLSCAEIKSVEEMVNKVEEIWSLLKCENQAEPEALLKAIYENFNCEWDEDWTTWQTPTL